MFQDQHGHGEYCVPADLCIASSYLAARSTSVVLA